ncbi:MAG: UPF0147 family protein [Candidatus Aenigmatarchaeota archaeon]|nr:UPF0147 family protein [Nanoarchaeota archaeon]
MGNEEIVSMLDSIIRDRGVPRNIRSSLEESIIILNGDRSITEKISHIISILDDASTDSNISSYTRINIWNLMSALEGMKNSV